MSLTVVSVLILSSSIVLLACWLRFACQAILRRSFEPDYSEQVAQAHRLRFLAIGQRLATAPAAHTDCTGSLSQLERDYDALTYLLRNAITIQGNGRSRSERLLRLDFQLLRWWVRLQRFVSVRGCRDSLLEMIAILQYLGNILGRRLAVMARVFGSPQAVPAADGSKSPALYRWPESARGSRSQGFSSMVRQQGTDGATG